MRTSIITREGYLKLKEELDHIWRVERPEITEKVAWAASLGDRSENADYKENKRKLRQIDRRVRYLSKQIENLKVVDYSPEQEGKVFFGAWVEVESEDGDVKQFRIAGYDEIFDRNDYISVDTPMARALIGKEVDDEVSVNAPDGETLWYINKISYQPLCAEKTSEAP
jgi:transcription elongation factor GreB